MKQPAGHRFHRMELAAQLSREFLALGPGSRIPGGHALAQRLGASYMTVVRALDELALRGEIVRIPNRGSFIAAQRVRELYYFTPCPPGVWHFETAVLDGALKEARHMGVLLRTLAITQTNHFNDIDWNNLRQLPEGAGVMLDGMADYHPTFQFLMDRHCRVAIVDSQGEGIRRHFAEVLAGWDRVVMPRFEVVLRALKLFKAAGRKRVLLLHTGAHEDNPIRVAFREGLARLGMEFSSKLELYCTSDYYAVRGNMQTFLWQEYPFDAVLCVTVGHALGCYDLFRQRKIRVPEDVAIIALADAPVLETNDVGITAVFWSSETAGKELVKLLASGDPTPCAVELPVCVARRTSV